MTGIDPRNIQRLMKQMGMQSRSIEAKSVIIETENERISITNPQITEIVMGGQRIFQVAGNVKVNEIIRSDDIGMVAEQAGVSREEAEAALKKTNGDIAEAILLLSKEKL